MPPDKQIEANQSNAHKSTGPTTPEGKEITRLSAVKQGISAHDVVVDQKESAADFTTLLADLTADHQPQTRLEYLLVQQIASCYWRLRRVLRADTLEFSRALDELDKPQDSIDYWGTKVELSAPTLPPRENLDSILRYEKAIHNQIDRALNHLDRLQQRRTQKTPNVTTPPLHKT